MSVISSYFWAFGARFSSMFLNFGATLILARLLTPEDFGKIGVVMVIITISQALVDSGMASGIINEKNVKQDDYSTVFLFNLITSIVLYLLIFVAAPYCNVFFNTNGLTNIVRLISLQIIVNSFQIIPVAKLTKRMDFRTQFWVTMTAQFIAATCAIIFAYFQYGVWALVLQNLLFSLCNVIGFVSIVGLDIKCKFSTLSFRKYFSFGAFITLSNIVDQIYENILSLFIGKYMGLAQVGNYTQAKRIETIPTTTLTQVVNKVTFPLLSKYKDSEDLFIVTAEKTQRILLTISISILSLICYFSDKIIIVLLGEKWMSASYYLVLLSIAGVWIIIENTSKTFLKALAQTKFILYSSVVKRLIAISFVAVACLINIDYLLFGYIIGCLTSALINSFIVSKCVSYSFLTQIKTVFKFALASLVMVAVFSCRLFADSDFRFVTIYIVGLASFFVVLYICGLRDFFELINKLLLSRK